MHHQSTSAAQPYTTTHHATLTREAYQTHPGLYVRDCDTILQRLEQRVERFVRRFKTSPPIEQAVRFVCQEAERHAITERILVEHGRLIHKSIHLSVWTSAVDLAVEHGDLFSEISFEIFKRAHSLNRAGTAKLSTRIYSLAKKHCWFAHNSKNRRRHRLNREQSLIVCGYGVETVSDRERAALKADAKADMVWDSGYSECGLSVN